MVVLNADLVHISYCVFNSTVLMNVIANNSYLQ